MRDWRRRITTTTIAATTTATAAPIPAPTIAIEDPPELDAPVLPVFVDALEEAEACCIDAPIGDGVAHTVALPMVMQMRPELRAFSTAVCAGVEVVVTVATMEP